MRSFILPSLKTDLCFERKFNNWLLENYFSQNYEFQNLVWNFTVFDFVICFGRYRIYNIRQFRHFNDTILWPSLKLLSWVVLITKFIILNIHTDQDLWYNTYSFWMINNQCKYLNEITIDKNGKTEYFQ